MYNFSLLFLMFIFFSFCGWLIETTGMSIINQKYTHRGFLIGPYCPVYGVGALCIIFFLKKYLNDPVVLFFMAIIITSFVEYITSFLMEKLFNARWWDYSDRKFNINGRICLINSLGFGILGLFLLYVIEPIVYNSLTLISPLILILISNILLIIFIIDIIISFYTIYKIKSNSNYIRKDNTEEIAKKVKNTLQHNIHLTKRIFSAFPKVKLLNSNISAITFKQALEKLELEKKQHKLKIKNELYKQKLKRKQTKLNNKKKINKKKSLK